MTKIESHTVLLIMNTNGCRLTNCTTCEMIYDPGHLWGVHLHLYELVSHPQGLDCVEGALKVRAYDFDRAARLIPLGKGPR